MWQATKNWFKRNRYPIAISAGLIGATYLTGQYVLGKINEARQRMSDDRIAKENLRRRFAQNQEDCTYTVLALLPTATENVVTSLPVEVYTAELQARRNDKVARSATGTSEFAPSETAEDSGSGSFIHASRVAGVAGENAEAGQQDSGNSEGPAPPSVAHGKSKAALWNDVKVASITRAITLLYTLSLLTLLTRIQLNLLGRRSYLSSVVSLATPLPPAQKDTISLENLDDDADLSQDYGDDFETNRMYLTFSWWLLHRGWAMVRDNVSNAVTDVFRDVNPRDSITFPELAARVLEVRRRVEGHDEDARRRMRWLEFLLPPPDAEADVLRESGMDADSPGATAPTHTVTPSLRRLLDETSDIIDSPTFSHVLTLTLDASFSYLVDDRLATQAFKLPPSLGDSRITELSGDSDAPGVPTAKLATILAVITRQAHVIGSGGNLNSFMASTTSGVFDATPPAAPPNLKDANEYLAVVEGVRDLEAFAAVVYSSNFELEGIEDRVAGADDEGRDVGGSVVDVGKEVELKLEGAWGKAVAEARDAA